MFNSYNYLVERDKLPLHGVAGLPATLDRQYSATKRGVQTLLHCLAPFAPFQVFVSIGQSHSWSFSHSLRTPKSAALPQFPLAPGTMLSSKPFKSPYIIKLRGKEDLGSLTQKGCFFHRCDRPGDRRQAPTSPKLRSCAWSTR